jgi:hypothetical protein
MLFLGFGFSCTRGLDRGTKRTCGRTDEVQGAATWREVLPELRSSRAGTRCRSRPSCRTTSTRCLAPLGFLGNSMPNRRTTQESRKVADAS